MVIKGILDPEDARDAVRFGVMGLWFLTTVAASWTAYSLLSCVARYCRCSER